ncbi:DEAD/DEAH box helicase [Robertmurraya massiliosenegalensis]|uniref:DEAD/DEAH box helicase n=1 Tax=Robertmurraya massiliosenegalensis TaxID=1287657 RepID=UPI0003707A91|nr:DEAD/DEAH box helicase [Robertmurraya massiliosenegalensis]
MRFARKNEILVPDRLLDDSQLTQTIAELDQLPHPPRNPQFQINPEIRTLLIGKQLLLDEIPHSLEEIQLHYENGYIALRKGMVHSKSRPQCQRCGNNDPHWFATFPCSRCQKRCTYCRKCIMMGRVSTCTPLYSWVDAEGGEIPAATKLEWKGTLSPGQQLASDEVVQAISRNEDTLIWAVCGAGKTEVLFEGIHSALSQQKRVCIATPRTDVVLELAPRLQAVFPKIDVASLYGGSEDRHKCSPLTISTTHQLFRFYQAFDTMIVDEVDAFPYSMDETLQFAVQNARKPNSSMIYLTATPNTQWQKDCRLGKRNYVTIPARYHRHPLPVPRFEWCGNWDKALKQGKLPKNVMKWLKQRLATEKQALFFIPRIDLIPKILSILRQLDPRIEAVHAEDPERKTKVQFMRDKKIPILVTTTILERGVTFPNLDVAILGSEEQIFTESALVQIAGRVGRSAQFPTGDIRFFHNGQTEAMNLARKQIHSMNKEAAKKGLIDT